MFENEIAEEEAKTRDFRRRESAQLKELKRGRGRPKKIREGALAPANKRDIVSVKDTLNSEETSSDTESENSSLASHEGKSGWRKYSKLIDDLSVISNLSSY